jgi:VRR-NUC domain
MVMIPTTAPVQPVSQLVSGQAPPPDYYAENLGRLIAEVAMRHSDLMAPEERALAAAWNTLSVGPRRLLARILSRKGPWIRVDSLNYPEVACSERALQELESAGVIARNPVAPADALLKQLTVPELHALFPLAQARRKFDVIAELILRHSDDAIRGRVGQTYPWIALQQPVSFARLQVLFFGSMRDDLTTFILEDLGIRRFESYRVDHTTRAFSTPAELNHYLSLQRCSRWLETNDWSACARTAARSVLSERTKARATERVRSRLLNQLGAQFEREQEFDLALECYGASSFHPARERSIRMLQRLGDESGAQTLIQEAEHDPWSAAEEDFIARQRAGKRRMGPSPVINEQRRSADEIERAMEDSIEVFACTELAREHRRAWHLENQFPLGLAGVLFWDVIYAPVAGAFTHRYQAGPRDLFWPDFAARRAAVIAARVEELADAQRFQHQIMEITNSKRNITNRLVKWSLWDHELVEALTSLQDHRSMVTLAHHVITHLDRARTGFPDLLVIDTHGVFEFVEVKSPTDQLQPAQRTWLRTLAQLGLSASVRWYRK